MSRIFEKKEQVVGVIHGESECCHRHCHFALAPVKIMAMDVGVKQGEAPP
jgi:hypothetical protein